MKKLQLKKEVIEKLDDGKMMNAVGGNINISLRDYTCPEFCQTDASFRVGEHECTQTTSDTKPLPLDSQMCYDQQVPRSIVICGSPSYADCITDRKNTNCC